MGAKFSQLLKSYRLRAGYGLRRFAELIGDAPSNYAHRESGKRGPWRDREKLREVAESLSLREGSPDWDAFFFAASEGQNVLPPDTEHMLTMPMMPALLRTMHELGLSEDELRALAERDLKKLVTGWRNRNK